MSDRVYDAQICEIENRVEGIMYKKAISQFLGLLVTASLFYGQTVNGQPALSNIPPSLIDRFSKMSPSEQEKLAQQYGLDLSIGASKSANVEGLASPGEQLISSAAEQNEEVISTTIMSDDASRIEKPGMRYGRALFNRDVSTFAPTDDAPVPESYRLGVGDQLVVQLFGKENDQLNLQIGRSGEVSFPKLGAINLSGLTFEDARDLLKVRVKQQFIGVEAVVSMGRLRSINVFMAGEVAVPGAYSVSGLTTVTQALYQAGGVTDIGSLRHISVRRSGKEVSVFDVYDLLINGDASGDIRLNSGDVIFVPPYEGTVEVRGEVKRPMVYELSEGETIEDVIKMAGSFSKQAFPSSSLLTRRSDKAGLPEAITLDLSDSMQLAGLVLDGDVLSIPRSGNRVANSVQLNGAVVRSGSYGWTEGMRVSDLLQDVRRDLRENADLSAAMIVRQKNNVLDIEPRLFDLGQAINSPYSESDPILEEHDKILVFSSPTEVIADGSDRSTLLKPIIEKLISQAGQSEPVGLISISGAVRTPGVYPLIAGETLVSMIKFAGGFTDSAYIEAVELRRVHSDDSRAVRVSYEDIDLTPGSENRLLHLQSRDHLTVREIPDWSPEDSITIEGEVVFPGQYLLRKGERISEVIARAGGPNDNASLEGALFFRESIAQRESERAADFATDIETSYASRLLTQERTTQTIQEISQITASLRASEGKGRLLIDLPAALSGASEADIEVEDGDKLIIPKRSNTVAVIGEVKRAQTHTYMPDLMVLDYVDLSAGYTRRADEDGVYLIKANGVVVGLQKSLWRFGGNEHSVEPGDTVVVPIDTQYKDSLSNWSEITQIVYQSMVSLAAVAAL